MEIKTLNQRHLSEECFMIQAFGKHYCKNCPYLETDECGGKDILETGKNNKGYKVPI